MTASSKPAAKTSPHARFIPREEIAAVAVWKFSAVDGSDEALATQAKTAPQAPPACSPTEQDLPEQLLHAVRAQAYVEGFTQGQQAGGQAVRDALELPLRKSADETAQRLAQLLHHSREQLRQSEEQIAQHLLELACDLARQVLRQELQSKPQHLLPLITEALTQLIDDGLPVTVRLHPGDLVLLQGPLQEALSGSKPQLLADASISPGGCLIETAHMGIDATLEKRWLRAIGNLGLNTSWNPENADV
ncbi:FliH/SctL family protein [Hydrogenophaga sp.]|uniref:FliH/SctL family protein n=1 Tax=Hydrogenophaga sp. TaxID=1904254 RepID=UPI0019B25AF0|nr:FliH/SctL family protein [Hydrogenophaga sp.]MBD3894208.1 flagellar assembly protein FliH [Hydrogenophaga sp.]